MECVKVLRLSIHGVQWMSSKADWNSAQLLLGRRTLWLGPITRKNPPQEVVGCSEGRSVRSWGGKEGQNNTITKYLSRLKPYPTMQSELELIENSYQFSPFSTMRAYFDSFVAPSLIRVVVVAATVHTYIAVGCRIPQQSKMTFSRHLFMDFFTSSIEIAL